MIENPYVQGHITKLKIILPCDGRKAWELIATPEGLAGWFPDCVVGKIAKDEEIEFHWPGEPPGKFTVLDVVEGRWWEMSWYDGSRIRYAIEENGHVIFKLEVSYSRDQKGKEIQILVLAPWGLMLANLKSRILNGPDLRNNDPAFPWKDGYLC